MKLLLSLLFVFCSLPSLAQASRLSQKDFSRHLVRKDSMVYISQSRYITSGVVGLLGFGIGHAIQGRWLERGWMFTAGSSLVVVGIVGSGVLSSSKSSSSRRSGSPRGLADFASFVSLLLVPSLPIFHIWGVVDTWWLPSHYKITNVDISSKFYSYKDKNFIGLSLNYKW